MASVAGSNIAVDNDLTLFGEVAERLGRNIDEVPRVQRRWVQSATSGHVAGLLWRKGDPQIALLHPEGFSAHYWDGVAIASTVPLAAIDRPGHGRSSWRSSRRYGPQRTAAGVADAIRSFAPQAAAVVGAGVGGLAALAAGARKPNLVRAVVLVDVTPGSDPRLLAAPPLSSHEASADAIVEELERLDRELALVVDAGSPRRLVELETVDDDGVRWWRHDLEGLREPAEPLDPGASWADLDAFPGPVALVRGERSRAVTEADVSELLSHRADASVVVVPDVGDHIALHRPAELASAIAAFVSLSV